MVVAAAEIMAACLQEVGLEMVVVGTIAMVVVGLEVVVGMKWWRSWNRGGGGSGKAGMAVVLTLEVVVLMEWQH